MRAIDQSADEGIPLFARCVVSQGRQLLPRLGVCALLCFRQKRAVVEPVADVGRQIVDCGVPVDSLVRQSVEDLPKLRV